MKKKICLFLVAITFCTFLFSQEENKETSENNEEISDLYLTTGLRFTLLSINGYEFYDYYDSNYAPSIVEVISVDKSLYKLVYAEPLNKAGALKYVTLYLKDGDLIGLRIPYSDSIVGGVVMTGIPNQIVLKGKIFE